jgi:hypothetical protein
MACFAREYRPAAAVLPQPELFGFTLSSRVPSRAFKTTPGIPKTGNQTYLQLFSQAEQLL